MRRSVFLSSALTLIAMVLGGWGGSTIPSLKLIRTIGDRSQDGENRQLQIPTDIGMNKDRQTYVIEAGRHLVTIFDSYGRRVKQFGNFGANPAEFYYPYSLDLDAKGTIYISDLGNNRIQCFDQDGTYRNELPFPTGNMRVNHSGEISVTRARGDFDYAVDNTGLFLNGKNVQMLTPRGDIRYPLSPELKYENGQMDAKGNEVYVDLDESDNIVIAYAYRPLIEKYDSAGRLVWRKEPRLNFASSMPGDQKDPTDAFREVQMNQCHAGVAADPQGRVWVVTLRRQLRSEERAPTNLRIMRGFDGRKKLTIDVMRYGGPAPVDAFEIDVYGPDGDFLSRIPLAHFADQIRIFGSDLFIVDSYHFQRVYHYEITD